MKKNPRWRKKQLDNMNEPDKIEQLIEQWRGKYTNIPTPNEEELSNRNEEEKKHPKQGRRREDAQDQRIEDMDTTAKKQRTEYKPLRTQMQEEEENKQDDGKSSKNSASRAK